MYPTRLSRNHEHDLLAIDASQNIPLQPPSCGSPGTAKQGYRAGRLLEGSSCRARPSKMNTPFVDWEARADRYERRRWLLSALAILSCSASALIANLRSGPSTPLPASPPMAAMVVKIAPVLRTPTDASAQPPGKPQVEAAPAAASEPNPELESEPETVPKPEPAPLPEPLPAAPADISLPHRTEHLESKPDNSTVQATAPRTTAPPPQEAPPGEVATAPRHSAPSRTQSVSAITFEQRLLAHLERHKRYPLSARRRRQQGVSYVHFMVDRTGYVLSVRLERGSGYGALDEEALDLLERAQPLPSIPDSMADETLEIVVPVEFSLR